MNSQALNTTIVSVLDSIWPLVLAGAVLVTFISVVTTGFEIIMNRKDDDKRKESIKSLIYVAIGTVVIVGSLFITSVILGTAGEVADNLQSGQGNDTTFNELLN